MNIQEFCVAVDMQCTTHYGVDDGGDLCHNLIESGEISMEDGVQRAAAAVAQRIQQP